MDPKELITALGVYADPNASDEDKAAALEKLTSFFSSLLDQEAQEAPADAPVAAVEAASEMPAADPPEAASEAGAEDPAKKEMASALAQIQALTARIAKMEKASAVGGAVRAPKSTVLPRVAAAASKDPVVSIIEAAERNTLRNLSK